VVDVVSEAHGVGTPLQLRPASLHVQPAAAQLVTSNQLLHEIGAPEQLCGPDVQPGQLQL
jgi:hypothetical protein